VSPSLASAGIPITFPPPANGENVMFPSSGNFSNRGRLSLPSNVFLRTFNQEMLLASIQPIDLLDASNVLSMVTKRLHGTSFDVVDRSMVE